MGGGWDKKFRTSESRSDLIMGRGFPIWNPKIPDLVQHLVESENVSFARILTAGGAELDPSRGAAKMSPWSFYMIGSMPVADRMLDFKLECGYEIHISSGARTRIESRVSGMVFWADLGPKR